jgi:hypothetical protein
LNVTSLTVSGDSSKSLLGKQVSILGNSQWSGGDIILNASTIVNYGDFTTASLHASILDLDSTNVTFSNFGTIQISASSDVSVQALLYHFGQLTISANSTLDLESSAKFSNGSSTTVDGTIVVGEGSSLGILSFFFHYFIILCYYFI